MCRGKTTLARGMAACVRDGYRAFRRRKFECGCCEMLVFMVCDVQQNLYFFVQQNQLVVGTTQARGGTLDLLMTDVPDLVRVYVVAPIGNSDYSSLSAVISMAQAVPNLCVSRKVFLKHQVNWNTVYGAIRYLPWRNI